MSNITVTYRDGRVAQLEQVYIRGSKIRFLILPDMLKNAPMLKSMKNKNQGSGAGRGKAAILKAQGEWDSSELVFCLIISKDLLCWGSIIAISHMTKLFANKKVLEWLKQDILLHHIFFLLLYRTTITLPASHVYNLIVWLMLDMKKLKCIH